MNYNVRKERKKCFQQPIHLLLTLEILQVFLLFFPFHRDFLFRSLPGSSLAMRITRYPSQLNTKKVIKIMFRTLKNIPHKLPKVSQLTSFPLHSFMIFFSPKLKQQYHQPCWKKSEFNTCLQGGGGSCPIPAVYQAGCPNYKIISFICSSLY